MIELQDLVTAITIVSAVVGAIYLFRYVAAQNTMAELASKDGVIRTWEQNNDANEHRIAVLEQQVATLTEQYTKVVGDLAKANQEIVVLREFTAPAAIKRFEKQQDSIIAILQAIEKQIGER